MSDVLNLARPQGAPRVDDFQVGDWLVQPDLNRVSTDGKCLHLRPQLMDVLVCLAQHRGGTVPRSELLTQVWSGQYVAETALARCVAELRQALGDRAHQPTIIETIPKRGYRLVAPVTTVEPRSSHDGRLRGVAGRVPMAPARVYTFPPQAEGVEGRLLTPVAARPAVLDAGGGIEDAAATAAPEAAAGTRRALGRWFALLGWAGAIVSLSAQFTN